MSVPSTDPRPAVPPVSRAIAVPAMIALSLLIAACAGQRAHTFGDEHPAQAWNGDVMLAGDGYRLPLRRWGPDDPRIVVLALHGFNDHSGSMETLALALAGHGIAVYAHDQRGFGATVDRGRWAGGDLLVADAALVAERLRGRYPDRPLYLVGKSMGGAVAALAAIRETPPVDGVVLIAPAMWARATMPWYQRGALWLGRRLFPGVSFSGRLLQRFVEIRPTDDPAVMAQLRADPLVLKDARADTLDGVTTLMDDALAVIGALPGPTLILYGGRDDIIPPQAACALLGRVTIDGRERRLAYYPDGYHMLTRQLHAQPVFDDIAAWLDDPAAAPLPSGHEIDHTNAVTAICEGGTIE
jgi:acylglycerol lipase